MLNAWAYGGALPSSCLAPALRLGSATFRNAVRGGTAPDTGGEYGLTEGLAGRLALPPAEKIAAVVAYLEKSLNLDSSARVYLHGSARWHADPGDWDVVIFVRGSTARNQVLLERGKLTDGPVVIDYAVMNETALRRAGRTVFDDPLVASYLLNVYLLGDVIGGNGFTVADRAQYTGDIDPMHYLNTAQHAVTVSYSFTDILDIEERLSGAAAARLALDTAHHKTLIRDAGKSIFNAALLLRAVLDRQDSEYRPGFYSTDDIFALWTDARNNTLERQRLEGLRQTIKAAIRTLKAEIANPSQRMGKNIFLPMRPELDQAI